MNTIGSILLLVLFLLGSCNRQVTETSSPVKEVKGEGQTRANRMWRDADTLKFRPSCPGKILPLSYRLLEADTVQIKKQLLIEGDFPGVVSKDTVFIELPLPDGSWEKFRITQVQVMAPVLAAKYPDIKTWSGNSTLYPADQVRLEVNSYTARIMILSTRGTILLESFCSDNRKLVMSFYKKNMPEGSKEIFERK